MMMMARPETSNQPPCNEDRDTQRDTHRDTHSHTQSHRERETHTETHTETHNHRHTETHTETERDTDVDRPTVWLVGGRSLVWKPESGPFWTQGFPNQPEKEFGDRIS